MSFLKMVAHTFNLSIWDADPQVEASLVYRAS